MKAMKTVAKAMSKGDVTKAIATECELKPKECAGMIDSLVAIGTKEVKKVSKTKLHSSLLAGPLDVDSEAPPTSYQLCTRFLQELALQYPNLCEGACHKGTEKKYASRLE